MRSFNIEPSGGFFSETFFPIKLNKPAAKYLFFPFIGQVSRDPVYKDHDCTSLSWL
ncbi:MAG: hypothetical protein PHW63_02440 [Alphaproteobacteria bacterium]|nr:hypothetical protein [Alphaproteobacteria bacterium]